MVQQLNEENAQKRRPLANYEPDPWGDQFLDYTPLDEVTQNQKEEEAKELKELVRKKLVADTKDPEKRLEYVDAILRLGVGYHYQNEIEDILQMFCNNNLHCDDYCHRDDDLHYVSLLFRLLRQHGLYASCDVFRNFKCKNGLFKDSLASDVQGILSLYEASYLKVHGETILEEALAFATTHLASFVADSSSPMAQQIAHSLELPLHKRSIRLETRYQIKFYELKPCHDKILLSFAKLDFNLLQELHKMELREYTRWSRNLDSVIKLPKFMRDRVVQAYFWSLGAYHEPQYSYARMYGSKMIKIISIIDDIYDSYGIGEELESFTEAIQRWDKSCINQLPDYLKLFYEAILDTFEEIEQSLANKGRSYAVYYARQQMIATCQGYFQESKWRHGKIVPTYDDYFNNGLFSSGYLYIIAIYFVGLEIATEDAFEWLNHDSKTPRASCIITRLLDDIAGHKFEQQREHVVSSVECYMAQFCTSEKEAYREIQFRIEEVWKDINEELVGPTNISKPLLNRVVNLIRILYDYLRLGEDGYTIPKYSQPKIAAVLVDPII